MGQLIFSIAALKRAFGTFEWAKPATDAFVMNEYLDHYGLRFRSDARYVHGFFPATNYKIATQAWLPPKPVGSLFVVHGYFDHVGLYRHLINWALNQELAVFAFDLPGHGLSSGPAAAIDDFQEYQTVFQAMLSLAKEQMPRPWHAVGQSTGAGILADYALQQVGQTDQSLFSQTVLLAPLLRVTSWGAITMTWQLLRRFQNHVPRSFAKTLTIKTL